MAIEPSPQGAPDTNTDGETLYALPTLNLPPGGKSTIKVTYSTAPARPAGASSTSNFTPVYLALGVMLVGAVAIVIFLAMRKPPSISTDESDGDESASRPEETAGEDAEDDEGWAEGDDDAEFEWGEPAGTESHGSDRDRPEPSDDPFDLDER